MIPTWCFVNPAGEGGWFGPQPAPPPPTLAEILPRINIQHSTFKMRICFNMVVGRVHILCFTNTSPLPFHNFRTGEITRARLRNQHIINTPLCITIHNLSPLRWYLGGKAPWPAPGTWYPLGSEATNTQSDPHTERFCHSADPPDPPQKMGSGSPTIYLPISINPSLSTYLPT